MNTSRKFLTITGYLALRILVGIIIILVALHRLGLINAWLFPLKPVSVLLICVSLSCLMLAQILQKPKQQNQKLLRQPRSKPKRFQAANNFPRCRSSSTHWYSSSTVELYPK